MPASIDDANNAMVRTHRRAYRAFDERIGGEHVAGTRVVPPM
ncbi:hypothetical protein BSIN_1664 [Burkholderia singularis]|uniref:Uncharacterized protein n=1 Tax=Burkholderia singularis TaxID=1503053 RepID=A0A238GZH2_9BURK|nr:hypothetical protein BSIN_1664 [Burkholderia singularis]